MTIIFQQRLIINTPQSIKWNAETIIGTLQNTHSTHLKQLKNGQLHTLILTMPNKKYGQECLNCPLIAVERPRYKAFNIELFIKLSPATHG